MNEALLNDIKGLLFEYFIGFELATKYSLLPSFLNDCHQDKKLIEYEHKLQNNSDFVKKLRKMASLAADKIIAKNLPVISVKLVGNNNHDESDLELTLKTGEIIGLGIKLTKKNSFVNTKSGGISSFIAKYFNEYKLGNIFQNELNFLVDNSFNEMILDLHELMNIPYDSSFSSWQKAGLATHPGKLDRKSKKIVLKFYYKVIEKLYQLISLMKESDAGMFIKLLSPLVGRSNDNLIQLFCFYENCYDFSDIFIIDKLTVDSLRLIPPSNRAFFYLEGNGFLLQIRVKPMNVFTKKSLKVNCAVRFSC